MRDGTARLDARASRDRGRNRDETTRREYARVARKSRAVATGVARVPWRVLRRREAARAGLSRVETETGDRVSERMYTLRVVYRCPSTVF